MSAGAPAFSLVVPCWNEAASIPGLVERFGAASQGVDAELVLVDNGSTDRTAEVLSGLLETRAWVRKVALARNQGYGGGILAGLKEARGRFLGWTHADLQTDPADGFRALELLASCPAPERTLAKGRRTGRSLAARLFTWGMAAYASLRLGRGLWDINGQPVVFHRGFLETWPRVMPEDFTLDLAALYAAGRAGWQVLRFPVGFAARSHGRSTWDSGLASKWRMARAVARACGRLAREES
ncbi:MAG: glycosyltransferase family 2 protein [Elusimicrobia bacterium]|nr:glycosyltransferase family 2 protein [Elusimicrobiota bacterium]